MGNLKKILQCVFSFSEGNNLKKVEQIIEVFKKRKNVKILDYNINSNYNRTQVVIVGDCNSVKKNTLEAMSKAVELIDMRVQEGQYPRIGAVDIVYFIPIQNMSMMEAIKISREFSKKAGEVFNIPIFLCGHSATTPERQDINEIKKGEYEGMKRKMYRPEWKPDFGPREVNLKSGVTGVGARMSYVSLQVNLNTDNSIVGRNIVDSINYCSGGLRFCRAIYIKLKKEQNIQIIIDLVNYNSTNLYDIFEMIKFESKRYGVIISNSEILGVIPIESLIDTAKYYLKLKNFSKEKILTIH